MRDITVKFGALNPPIKVQLQKQGLVLTAGDDDKCEKMRKYAAYTRYSNGF